MFLYKLLALNSWTNHEVIWKRAEEYSSIRRQYNMRSEPSVSLTLEQLPTLLEFDVVSTLLQGRVLWEEETLRRPLSW